VYGFWVGYPRLLIGTLSAILLSGLAGTLTAAIPDNAILLRFQGFESSVADNWLYTPEPGPGGFITVTNQRAATGTNSIRITGPSSSYTTGSPSVVFSTVNLTGLTNVGVSAAFSANGPDTDDDLFMDLSYDGGSTWSNSVKLVDGFNNANIPFGGINGNNPTTVSNNPWTVSIHSLATQVTVRIRFKKTSGSNGSIDNYFADDVLLFHIPAGQAPLLQMPTQAVALVSNELTIAVIANDIDGNEISISASNLPPGASFISAPAIGQATGTLYFTPALNQADLVITSTIHAVDADGSTNALLIIYVRDRVISWAASSTRLEESAGLIQLPVSISRATDASIQISATGKTKNGSDYSISSSALNFSSSGQATQYVALTIHDDNLAESTEDIKLSLTNPIDAEIGTVSNINMTLMDNDSFTLATANLTSSGQLYREAGQRILTASAADIVAIQEWKVTNSGGHRAFVDHVFGSNYFYVVESNSLPNGVISKWPIIAWGLWIDIYAFGRNHLWATIDLPGSRNLHVVSVHLDFSGGEGTRQYETLQLLNQLDAAGFPTNDYLAVCGDLNIQSYTEAAMQLLADELSDERRPADQNGVRETNQSRTRFYDAVLPSSLLNELHLPLYFNGHLFSEGIVFDTRTWTNALPPEPAQLLDSNDGGMAHMLVMKLFAIDPLVRISTIIGPNGSVYPISPGVSPGDDISIEFLPDPYYEISSIQSNASLLAGFPIITNSILAFNHVTSPFSLSATFSPLMATNSVPFWWLASYGLPTSDAEVLDDRDIDGFATWEEYIAGTTPTNEFSALIVQSVKNDPSGFPVVRWSSASGRIYNVFRSTNLAEGFTLIESGIAATPGTNIWVDIAPSTNGTAHYLIKVALP